MRQKGFNIVARIKNGQVEELKKVLKKVQSEVSKEMQGESTDGHLLTFEGTSTHLARYVLVDFDPGYPPQLLFGSNYDGKPDEYVDRLIKTGAAGLDAIWSKCKGYPEQGAKDPKAVKKFFDDHTVSIPTYYICYPGISVKSARNALDVWGQISDYLDKKRSELKGKSTQEIVDDIKKFVKDNHIHLEEGSMPRKNRFFVPILVVISLILLPIVLIPLLILYLLLRREEEKDTIEYHRTHTGNYVPGKTALEQEAQEVVVHVTQTQMTLADPAKPGLVRAIVLNLVLFVINIVARFTQNQGKLGDVRTVHFARWYWTDDKKRLIFFSNFDESWQQYIGAFVDLLPIYLTAIWSNAIRYPPTKNLVQEGANDIEGFMQFIREFQIPSGVFYSAYPKHSAGNIVNAVRMRTGLGKKLKKEADRQEWLRHFAGTIALEDQKYPPKAEVNPVDPKVSDPGNHADIQAWIFTGYVRATHAAYLFLKIKDAAKARAWLKEAAEVTTAIETGWPDPVNIAFTAGGLRELGLPEDAMLTFPTEFRQGIAQEYDDMRPTNPSPRSQNLGDTGESAPEHWDVGGPAKPFDVLVLLHAAGKDGLDRHIQQERERIEKYDGLEVTYVQIAERLKKKTEVMNRAGKVRPKTIFIEHFGFRDGIAEPAIRDSGFNKTNQVTIAAGEFILGYKNQYDFFPITPSVRHELDVEEVLPRTWRPTARRDLGRNGTFVVFRKLPQDVYSFWKYYAANTSSPEEMIHLASRSVGRWPDGTPLTRSPDGPDPKWASVDYANDFLYVKDDDLHGYKCPFASHIRRSNPRDSLSTTKSLTIADRHHIIRRGVPYGDAGTLPPWDNGAMPEDDGVERGLMFFSINTSLRRQFEFVQVAWNNSPRFNGLNNTADPIMGPNPPDLSGDLALEAEPYRLRTRKIPRFTTVSGGAYLFLPSISALKFLARMPV